MKYPRTVKPFRGQLEVAPFAGVFVVLLMFLLLHTNFVYIPGVRIDLPPAEGLPGTTNPTVVVAVDRNGQLIFENQIVKEPDLLEKLTAAVARHRAAKGGLTLVVQADKSVAYEVVVRLAELARAAGIKEVLQATRPAQRPVNTPAL